MSAERQQPQPERKIKMSISVSNPNEPRAFTNAVIENAELGVFSWEEVAKAALGWMSEDDVRRMAESELDMEAEEKPCDADGLELDEGDKVEWTDPDPAEGLETNLGEISKINGETITVEFLDGGEAEVYGRELRFIPYDQWEKRSDEYFKGN
jgi:hypothetical protein